MKTSEYLLLNQKQREALIRSSDVLKEMLTYIGVKELVDELTDKLQNESVFAPSATHLKKRLLDGHIRAHIDNRRIEYNVRMYDEGWKESNTIASRMLQPDFHYLRKSGYIIPLYIAFNFNYIMRLINDEMGQSFVFHHPSNKLDFHEDEFISFFDLYTICSRKIKNHGSEKGTISDTTYTP